ncbi:glycosyltransferase family 2 protein [Pseudoclavibacter soli]|uniref:glycosyltransferase family 2 protein n=1 Tax=Pseudoclavibacter soli TaxID=452623 RepID=UPI0009FF2BB6|nr:glycosyltransferase [Pseudoclavibacter soli]
MPTDSPFVHFFIPYYGPVSFIQETVKSVREQQGNWHLTIIDDQSPYGDIRPWLAQLNDDRITYLKNEVNLGLGANFQRCLSLSKGRFTVLLGDDDRLLPQYVDRLHAADLEQQFDVYQPVVEVINESGVAVKPLADRVKALLRPRHSASETHRGDRLTASLMTGNWTYFPSLAWRTDVIQPLGFNVTALVTIDLDLLMKVLVRGGSMYIGSGAPTFQYRRHARSVSSTQALDGPRFKEEQHFFESQAAIFDSLGWRRSASASRLHLTSRVHAMLSSLRTRVIGRSSS